MCSVLAMPVRVGRCALVCACGACVGSCCVVGTQKPGGAEALQLPASVPVWHGHLHVLSRQGRAWCVIS